ncbi:MAG TPA: STAS domain-containing protein [Pyrinomonadaceae bacterium]|jgi:anti-sigma B factor antagonist|nr:STAS domain-containing protein [Pyrinomonadaceae bacterium]
MSDLNITTRQNDGVTVLDLAGKIALGDTSSSLHQALRTLVQEGKTQVLINLQNVSSIDSSGLGSLIAGYATLEKNDGSMKLVNLSPRVTELMTITKLFTVFEVFEDEGAAVASFVKTGGAADTASSIA